MQVGEVWAYRARQTDPLVQVVVMRIGVRKLARVLVKFVDDVFEGRQEWVPPARLKVLWTDAGDFETADQRWEHIWERGIGLGDPRWEAADEIMRLLVKEDLAELRYREGGAIRIHQVDELARALNLPADVFTGNPDAFYEDRDLVVPWEVTELIVTTAARQDPDPVMAYVQQEEANAFHQSIHDSSVSGRRGAKTYVEPEDCSKIDRLRTWCGSEASARFDEMNAAKIEARRVTEIAERGIVALQGPGQTGPAARLSRELREPGDVQPHISSE